MSEISLPKENFKRLHRENASRKSCTKRGLVDRQATACLLSGEAGIHITEVYDIHVSSTKGIPAQIYG